MVRRGMIRGLEREKVNSDFMRLKNYTVVDNPALLPSNGLNSRKAPDHRINGKIFDSYAPKMKVTVNSSWILDSKNPFTETRLDELSPPRQELWRSIEGKYILNEITYKVREGQTRNILLNLADMGSGGELCQTRNILLNLADMGSGGELCQTRNILLNLADTESGGQQCEFAEFLNQVEDLESVIAIYPKPNAPDRGYSPGGGEVWNNHFATDMEAMEWKHDQTCFHPLPDGAMRQDKMRQYETSDSEDSDDQNREDEHEGKDNPNRKGRPSSSKWNPSSTESDLSESDLSESDLSLLHSFFLVFEIFALGSWLFSLFGSKKKKERSKSSESAVAIYVWYMGSLLSGRRPNPEDLATAHHDLKDMIPKLLPPGSKADDIDEILDDEYIDVIIDLQVYTFLEIFSPFYETIVLFIYSISRFVSTFITIATKNKSENSNIIGTHVALVLVSLLAQRFLQSIFLGMFCGPLESVYYLCMISLAIRLVNAHASSAISYASGVLWEKTERNNVSSSKYTLPKRVVVILVAMVLVTLLGRLFMNISIASAVFKVPAVLQTPFLYLVTRVLFVALFVVLFLFSVQMAWPSGVLNEYLDKEVQGFSLNNIADASWKEIEIFMKLKSSSR